MNVPVHMFVRNRRDEHVCGKNSDVKIKYKHVYAKCDVPKTQQTTYVKSQVKNIK